MLSIKWVSPFSCPHPSAAGQTKTPVSVAHGVTETGMARIVVGQACKTTAAFRGVGLVSGLWYLAYHAGSLAWIPRPCAS